MKEVIAIDGPAGAGKSTVARLLARKLGFLYLDTGALYRALTLKALRAGVDLEDENALAGLVSTSCLDLREIDGKLAVFLDGEDVSAEIRTPEVTEQTFHIAASPLARAALLPVQRSFAERDNLVVEGRDTTTVVFPRARLKVYLDAPLDVRAARREKDLIGAGIKHGKEKISAWISERDRLDRSRSVAPLRKAPDAVYLDSGDKTIEEEVDSLARLFLSRLENDSA